MATNIHKITITLCLAIVISLFTGTVMAAEAKLTHLQIIKFPNYARLIVSLSEPIQYHVFTLSDPYRIVIDLSNTRLKTNVKNLNFSDSMVKAIRFGWPKSAMLRLVLDVDSVASFKKFLVVEHHSHESQLVIDISPVIKVSASKKIKTMKVSSSQEVKIAKAKPVVLVSQSQTKIKKEIMAPAPVSVKQEEKQRIVTVVIDAGHGGKDPGTIGPNGTKEKTVVLSIAKHLAELINKDPHMHAILTRKGDYFVPLRKRLSLAHSDKADLFIAIHADSYLQDSSSGVSVFALSHYGATSEAARWLAKNENNSELGGVAFGELGDHSDQLRSVLIDLAQTATIKYSLRLGTQMLSTLDKVAKLHYYRVEQAPFVVLKSPDIPSVLVETGFLSNPEEETRLSNKDYRDTLAQALLAGVHQYVIKENLLKES